MAFSQSVEIAANRERSHFTRAEVIQDILGQVVNLFQLRFYCDNGRLEFLIKN